MRFEVPQFIEVEDKIFGPFTWKQFVYLAGGVGLAVVVFFTMHPIIFALIGLPIGGLSVLLAFYPVNNRPFELFLESVVHFYRNSRVYHWRKKSQIVYRQKTDGQNAMYDRAYRLPGATNINTLSRRLEMNAIQKMEE